jgi:actin-related protein 8
MQTRRGSHVIVIHPGSRFLRIGRACDMTPASIPNVIARKTNSPVLEHTFVEGVLRPRKGRAKPIAPPASTNGDEYAVATTSDDPVRHYGL